MTATWPALLLVACGDHGAPRLESLGEALPHLPAPEAPAYATHLGRSPDPLVAGVADGLPWEEALSGAAGALGIEAAGGVLPDAWSARWAALRAGYPYPVATLSWEACAEGGIGQGVLDGLRAQLRPGDHLGLARVRGGDGDLWVGLIGRPRVALEPLPRSLPVGGTLALRAEGAEGVELLSVTPGGVLERGDLWQGRSLVLQEPGEHWFQLSDTRGILAAFPVMVGAAPPPAPPLAGLRVPVAEAEQLDEAAWRLLAELRADFDGEAPEADPILGPVARAHLGDRLGLAGPPSGPFAGSPGACRASLACALEPGEGAERCFQRWLVEPEARAALLDARCSRAGVAAARDGARLWLALELGER